MSPKKTPAKSLPNRNRKIEINIEQETVADVSKELDDYKRETDAKLKSLRSQIDELKERLGVLERNAE